MKNVLSFTIYSLAFVCLPLHAGERISYPSEYRQWSHVKSLTLHEGHALANPFKGIHHVYANPAAFKGIQTGRYPDGAKIVFDLLENKQTEHASAEGNRILLGVMVKDRQRFGQTGGWGFEAWKADSRAERLVSDGGNSCFACHQSQKKRDYVFSQWRK